MKIPFFNSGVNELRERASNALSIFTKTVDDLLIINQECNKEIKDREVIIEKATKEKDELNDIINSNQNIITKIEDIIK